MQAEQTQLNLPPTLYRQFLRLKADGRFDSDQALIQACFESLEREWERNSRLPDSDNPTHQPFMSRPALGLDDYDT